MDSSDELSPVSEASSLGEEIRRDEVGEDKRLFTYFV